MEVHIYTAYGDRVANTVAIARTGYTGAVSESGLPWYLLGLRFYVGWLRRFVSPDVASPFGAGGFNRYAYCLGDPINRIDPSGNASFGWLGKLLGHLMGTVGSATRTVALATPSAALAVIAPAAEALTVATSIGAIVAAAMGDESTAGIMGGGALGSGAADLGLGVAGHAMRKKTRARSKAGGDEYEDWFDRFGRLLGRLLSPWSSWEHTVRVLPYGGSIETFSGSLVADLPEIRSRIHWTASGYKEIYPQWQAQKNAAGGWNYMVDTEVDDPDIYRFVSRLHERLPKAESMDILLGVHGDFYGNNWKDISGIKRRGLGGEKWLYNRFADLLQEKPLDRQIRLHDLDGMKSSQLEGIVKGKSFVVHGYCYGAVDPEVMAWLNIVGSQKSYRL